MTGDNISRCDWYSATVNAPTDGLISGFLHHFDAVPRETVAHNSYKRAVEVVRGESRIATVSWGGVNLRPSVVSSGAASQEVMVYLRSLSSPHSVSRMDAAIDFVGTFVFSQITEMIIKILEEHKFRGVVPGISQVGDWIHGKARTLYVGSRNSRTFLRIYEKRPNVWPLVTITFQKTGYAPNLNTSRLTRLKSSELHSYRLMIAGGLRHGLDSCSLSYVTVTYLCSFLCLLEGLLRGSVLYLR